MSAALQLPIFDKIRILVVGELVLDKYVWGTVERISPEAPVPVFRVRQREIRPGNAAFVCATLRSLGASVSVVSVTGGDDEGRVLRQMLRHLGVEDDDVIADPSRPTIVKQRLLGSVQSAMRGTQQLLRLDEEDPRPLDSHVVELLLHALERQIPEVDGIFVSDINKGLLTATVLRGLIDGANRHGVPIIVDPRLSDDLGVYRGATALTPNRYEAEHATKLRLTDRNSWEAAGQSLLRDLDLDLCLVTLDREGMFLCERSGSSVHLPTRPLDVYDVTGAGDVALSVFGLCLVAGLRAVDAGRIANVAAGLEVEKQGASVISADELTSALSGEKNKPQGKVVPLKNLAQALTQHRNAGRKVSFAHGVFDALYSEDIRLLQFARSQGDVLVVGISGDDGGDATGEPRILCRAADRARLVAAMEAVDYVVVCHDASVESIIGVVRPDVVINTTVRSKRISKWSAAADGSRRECGQPSSEQQARQ